MHACAATAGQVAAVPAFEGEASRIGGVATTRYEYVVAGGSEPSVYVIVSPPMMPIALQDAPRLVERSMRKPVSLRCGSVQRRRMLVGPSANAERSRAALPVWIAMV